jgi:hypothetical protein
LIRYRLADRVIVFSLPTGATPHPASQSVRTKSGVRPAPHEIGKNGSFSGGTVDKELHLSLYVVPSLRITGIIPPKFITPFRSEQGCLYLNPKAGLELVYIFVPNCKPDLRLLGGHAHFSFRFPPYSYECICLPLLSNLLLRSNFSFPSCSSSFAPLNIYTSLQYLTQRRTFFSLLCIPEVQ